MKPSWDEAPDWARYLAQDYDGSWTWFEKKPSTNSHLNYWFRTGDNMMQRAHTQMDLWKETLEERPKGVNNE